MQLPHVFNRYRSLVDAELKSLLITQSSPLYTMMRYHLGWVDENGSVVKNVSGKSLRPTLCLLASYAVGGNQMAALPPAAAVELVHNFSLIHDDIQDDDAERRHRPTVWKIWGKPQGINAGTGMRIIANLALRRVHDAGLSTEKYSAMQAVLDMATLRLLEGQYLDIDFETHFDITVDDYIEMISGKTAALIACSLELGALSGCDNPITIGHFKKLGEHLGIAFQVRDDILGIWGDAYETGKAIGNDIVRKKKSLPIIYALTHGNEALRTSLIALYGQDTMDAQTVQKVIELLDDVQTKDHIQRMVHVHCEKAHECVNQLTIEKQAADELRSVIDFCAVRNY